MIKVHQQDARLVLRSRQPERVEQEVWGILVLHRALRSLIHDAALRQGIDPDRLSFTHTVTIVRRQVIRRAVSPLRAVAATLAAVTAEIAGHLLPKRSRSNLYRAKLGSVPWPGVLSIESGRSPVLVDHAAEDSVSSYRGVQRDDDGRVVVGVGAACQPAARATRTPEP